MIKAKGHTAQAEMPLVEVANGRLNEEGPIDRNGLALNCAEPSSQGKPSPGKLNIVKLTPTQAVTLPYPIGSTVWYRCGGQQTKSGRVISISFNVTSKMFQYEIKNTLEYNSIKNDE